MFLVIVHTDISLITDNRMELINAHQAHRVLPNALLSAYVQQNTNKYFQ